MKYISLKLLQKIKQFFGSSDMFSVDQPGCQYILISFLLLLKQVPELSGLKPHNLAYSSVGEKFNRHLLSEGSVSLTFPASGGAYVCLDSGSLSIFKPAASHLCAFLP